jgi:transcriptional regulator with XRE-family HTH domain
MRILLRQERQARHLTIRELGDKAGLSEIYVGEIERGQKYPSAKVLESLVKALEIEMAEFFELMVEEFRAEHEAHITNVIGFIPSTQTQPKRTVVKRIVNMLNEGDVESVANFSAFLLSQHLTPR